MSTRSEIIIKDYGVYRDLPGNFAKLNGKSWKQQIMLYHHHDGYPEGVGKFLMEQVYPLLQKSNDEYPDRIANFLIKHKEDDEFEITLSKHVDIEYRYVIDIPKKEIRCYAGHYGSWDNPSTRFSATKECDLSVFLPVNMKASYV